MKYIRTKDGRIGKFYQDQSFTITCSLGCVDKKDIIKQANTIEELCDEFVYVDEEIKQFLVSDDLDLYKAKQFKVFGAIWTDKGLIYVAKMNDKGELELL